MNLDDFCSVPEAATLGNLSVAYVKLLLADGRLTGRKIGGRWVVLKSEVAKFERQPGMGRPKKAKARRRKK